MKLLSVNLARSLWFCYTAELNPKGLNLYPLLIPLLIDSYKFKKYPSETEVHDETTGVKFELGEFISTEGKPIVINFSIFTDGLMAETRSSTQDSDAFLKEVLTRFSEFINLPHYEQIIRRINYVSQLYVETKKSLELINPKLREISKYLSNNIVGFGNLNFEVGGISFWAEQEANIKPINFSFERVLNIPFSENKYYSAAPLQTEKHLELLNKIESILSK